MSDVRPLSAIKVGVRHRKDLGDIDALARSVSEVGLLHPIVIRPDGRLIAGARRLEACKRLGWGDVPVTEVDLDKIVRGEFAENAMRKDFAASEIDAIRRALADQVATPVGRPKKETPESFRNKTAGDTRDKIGAFAGVSGRTVEKIAAVVEAAEAEPEKFADLVEEMDRTGKVDRAYKKLKVARAREGIGKAGPFPDGKYGVIYADPPWTFQVWSGEGKDRAAENHYPTQTLEQIRDLRDDNDAGRSVRDLAADNCALFLWAVMPQLPEALAVIEAWGFSYKTCAFVWLKQTSDGERFATGMGYWTRANAEVCLLATRGAPTRLNADVHQVIASPRMEHSAKPDEAAARIERLVGGPYVELFRRGEPRAGWKAWGNQVG